MPTAQASKRLTKKQTIDLVTRVQRDGDDEAFSVLLQDHLPFIRACIKDQLARLSPEYRAVVEGYRCINLTAGEDFKADEVLVFHGVDGLQDAIRKFKVTQGGSFRTSAEGWIAHRIARGVECCLSNRDVAQEVFLNAIKKVKAPLVSQGRVSPKAAKFVGELIYLKRTGKGFTLGDMGRQIGITRGEYGKIEAGAAKLSLRQLERIARALDASLTDFLTLEV